MSGDYCKIEYLLCILFEKLTIRELVLMVLHHAVVLVNLLRSNLTKVGGYLEQLLELTC